MPVVRLRAHRNGSLRGPPLAAQDTRQKPLALEHASIYSPSIRSPHGSANGYASMETYLLFVFISTAGHRILSVFISTAEHRIARAILERDHARAMNELARIGDVRSVFVFVFTSLYTKLKNNTVLLLPLTTKKQYRTALNPTNTKINNSTTVPLYMTPTYNSKTAIQYHMIYNNCPLFPLPCEAPFPPFASDPTLRQVANKLHRYIDSALATYFYVGIYLHADIKGHLLRRYSHDHLEQILNTSKVEILHHLVLATLSLLRDVQNTFNRPSA